MKDTGTVVSVDGTTAVVSVRAHGGCKTCTSRQYCDPGRAEKGAVTMQVRTQAGIVPGDRVEIELAPGLSLLASFTVFGVPLVAAVAGYFVGTAGGAGQERGALFSVGAVILVFGLFFTGKRLLPRTDRFMPRIVKKL